ncbi:MAG: quinone-dependent dihydroorotate dehydrogenase, partial [Acidobacteriota bacterium]|nr:quinone-dependent dihydroorotate dehydrogenase [Acidobacteriota bacterium]
MLYRLLRPLLFSMDPEFVHRQTIRLGRTLSRSSPARRLVKRIYGAQWKPLRVRVLGLDFDNPVGLAAGFDKQGELPGIIASLGFGHMEVGSISSRPWPGNPSPTLLRLPVDQGLINYLGLNSEGSEGVQKRLQKVEFRIPTGINLVKTADPEIAGEEAIEDYLDSVGKFYPLADYITLNLSCPNTVEGKSFEHPEFLQPFLSRLQEKRDEMEAGSPAKAFLVKLSPDLDDYRLGRLVELSLEHGIDGFVIGNTTSRREGLRTGQNLMSKFGPGGLSGRPLKKYIEQMIDKVFHLTGGRVPIVACGGVGCDPDEDPAGEVWGYLKRGATLVQMYTGLIYQGPSLVKRINRGLVNILQEEGISDLNEFLKSR